MGLKDAFLTVVAPVLTVVTLSTGCSLSNHRQQDITELTEELRQADYKIRMLKAGRDYTTTAEEISEDDRATLAATIDGLNGTVIGPRKELKISVTEPDGRTIEVSAPADTTCYVTAPSSDDATVNGGKSVRANGGSVVCVSESAVQKVVEAFGGLVERMTPKPGAVPADGESNGRDGANTSIAIPGKKPASLPAADEYFLPGVLGR